MKNKLKKWKTRLLNRPSDYSVDQNDEKEWQYDDTTRASHSKANSISPLFYIVLSISRGELNKEITLQHRPIALTADIQLYKP